ncbi:MAG: 30S ribosomal protein S20 [Actinomycetota bacterium]|jgi:small subunit ribosomal protein S20|nr:30S ribosomal protein S20 [Actinomycetota bacterium]
MANIKSQIKRNKQNEVARERNKAIKSELKTRVKNAVTEASNGTDKAEATLRTALSKLDKAVTKGIIHKNQAARRKSRLVAQIAKLTAK